MSLLGRLCRKLRRSNEHQCLIPHLAFLGVQSILTQPALTPSICGSMAVPRSISTAPSLSLPSLQASSLVYPVCPVLGPWKQTSRLDSSFPASFPNVAPEQLAMYDVLQAFSVGSPGTGLGDVRNHVFRTTTTELEPRWLCKPMQFSLQSQGVAQRLRLNIEVVPLLPSFPYYCPTKLYHFIRATYRPFLLLSD
jgi:hypothetical protein